LIPEKINEIVEMEEYLEWISEKTIVLQIIRMGLIFLMVRLRGQMVAQKIWGE